MQDKTKWELYEFRWKIRDFYFDKVLRQHLMEKYFGREPKMLLYAGKRLKGIEEANRILYEAVLGDHPFMAARFGNTEIQLMTCVMKRKICGETKETKEKFDKWFGRLCLLSGFFPDQKTHADRFTELMLDACSQTDLLGMWHRHMEDYIIRNYIPGCKITYLRWLEPWYSSQPWTAALKGKKVLVIHPFVQSIQKQYENREKLFPGTDILPEFELKLLKAVQTSGGGTDERFSDWFEALEYMYKEAMRIDFEVAVIGCGAYGMPLAAMLKKAGKKAIHLGGVTQILFGIRGKRWDESRVDKIPFNDAWIYPLREETPEKAFFVEGGCYWGSKDKSDKQEKK